MEYNNVPVYFDSEQDSGYICVGSAPKYPEAFNIDLCYLTKDGLIQTKDGKPFRNHDPEKAKIYKTIAYLVPTENITEAAIMIDEYHIKNKIS